ncbi:hypothetical protein A3D77_07445 [Candidatus Gottesmanbacteria bacterium RIFCSPHIGHO2_02_FULL_39_11]|uniref:Beta-lactamase class A catalytic domain-containing protein n=1 Tax=Candidatus Gottesmanbacteria bacterium RIFCSPHIGHO2_02_FULL_39_11 TaxID=1798382 RepID=A0A1F5ZSC1_9BACT|nr:MAG: hypothetical protein A3D77_07445 [Candidatus Gottesmanbacteria bacterium RIFCSPHIGHO2_02_FULL_39_11]
MSHLSEVRRRRKKKRLLLSLFLIIITSASFSYFTLNKIFLKKPSPSPSVLSQISEKSSTTPIPSLVPSHAVADSQTSFSDIVSSALSGSRGTYSVAFENLKTGERYYLNEHESYESGSLYKLWVMATVYNQIKNGILNEDDILSEDIPVLNKKFYITPENAEKTEGEITLSVADALSQMITISDNYSALLLTEKIRLSHLASFLKENGFTESSVGTTGNDPATTAYDAALFFKKLYQGELNEPHYTDKMLNLLKAQKLNNKIPKYLSKDITIAHKTGEIYGFSHDAGIVYTENGDYIISLFSESNNPILAEERIATLSKAVYTYLTAL